MLDLNYIRENIDFVEKKVQAKGVIFDKNIFLELDEKRRKLITESEALKSQKNKIAKEIGFLKRENKDSSKFEKESKEIGKRVKEIENELTVIEKEFNSLILNIPNIFHESVPEGKNENDNVVIKEWGKKPEFDFKPLPHWDIGEKSGGLDFKRASKLSGSRFALYFNLYAKLERVLINFMLDVHTKENGYIEVLPPFLVNDKSLIGTGNLPKFKDDLFKIENYNLYLIPTAEVPLTNIHRQEMLEESQLPIKYVAYTPCFRSEAGSYGKDIRGIIRQHQFNKVELLKFVKPEDSYDELEKLTRDAETILERLELNYRRVLLCSGDMSFSSAKTYDLEVWMPSKNGFMEISSCSNFESFQARRARIKYKTSDNKKDFVHTLNGSGLAVGRTVAAIIENYQTKDKGVRIPEVLRPYFDNKEFL